MKCTQTNFDGHGLSGFGDFALFVGLKKTAKFPFQTMDYHGGQKIELPQKNHASRVGMKCMETNFGGHGLSGFRDITPFSLPSKTAKISLQAMNYIVHGGQKIESAQKIYAIRGVCEMHGNKFW